ncbi:MAG: DUF3833 domain-containing protein [Burkholderiales bacterium]|nr:DUF3833 domain-containing protein [Burkholderiales bacterium]
MTPCQADGVSSGSTTATKVVAGWVSRSHAALTRLVTWIAGGALVAVLTACAGPQVQDYAGQTPNLDLTKYFNGDLVAHGVFTDRSGAVKRRFTVAMKCRWQGDEGVFEEDFTYSDGKTERRVWTLHREAPNRFTGRAADVIGTATGESAGNTLRWRYTLDLKVDDTSYEVQFDDWMFQMDDHVLINRAAMSKFGIHLGDVTLAFIKP